MPRTTRPSTTARRARSRARISARRSSAARPLGGAPEDDDVADERVFAKKDQTKSMTYAAAAQRAIDLGGKFSGKELPQDIHAVTKSSAAVIAGSGLVGVAKDNIAMTGTV